MLAELRIKNFVLIDELSVSFGPGLNVLSGETGAGKSIVLHALNLLLGGRASNELLREGADEALVEGLFIVEGEPWIASILTELGLEPVDELWIRRLISSSGRGRAYLNGGPVALSALRLLARGLVDFSSQNEHQVLLDPESHLGILDACGGQDELLEAMRNKSQALKQAFDARDALVERQRSRSEREEFLRFQLAELERVAPKVGEDEALENERKLLTHAEKLFENARGVEASLYASRGAVVEVLGEAVGRLQEIEQIDAGMSSHVESLRGALFMVEDVARVAGAYARKIRFDPERLEEIGARLAELNRVKRKYRTDLGGVVEKLEAMKQELEALEGAEERLGTLQQEVKSCWLEAGRAADALTGYRQKIAKRLEKTTEAELKSLSMPEARFEIVVEPRADLSGEPARDGMPGATGNDRVEFYFSANQGESVRPLAKVASGGELSRVLLALKRALAGAGEVGTFVFDEVDTGIGGAVAEVVGRKLREISRHRQLLCITHLSQIAAYADRHFIVHKEVLGGRTRSLVGELGSDERVEEIARMVGGLEITERTRDHARELIARCATYGSAPGETPWES